MSETDEVKLKDCPFCGSRRVGVAFGRAGCVDCRAQIDRQHNDQATEAWNQRMWEAEDQKIADAILTGSPRLTEEQREAIREAIDFFEWHAAGMKAKVYKAGVPEMQEHASVLRSLLSSDKEEA